MRSGGVMLYDALASPSVGRPAAVPSGLSKRMLAAGVNVFASTRWRPPPTLTCAPKRCQDPHSSGARASTGASSTQTSTPPCTTRTSSRSSRVAKNASA